MIFRRTCYDWIIDIIFLNLNYYLFIIFPRYCKYFWAWNVVIWMALGVALGLSVLFWGAWLGWWLWRIFSPSPAATSKTQPHLLFFISHLFRLSIEQSSPKNRRHPLRTFIFKKDTPREIPRGPRSPVSSVRRNFMVCHYR